MLNQASSPADTDVAHTQVDSQTGAQWKSRQLQQRQQRQSEAEHHMQQMCRIDASYFALDEYLFWMRKAGQVIYWASCYPRVHLIGHCLYEQVLGDHVLQTASCIPEWVAAMLPLPKILLLWLALVAVHCSIS